MPRLMIMIVMIMIMMIMITMIMTCLMPRLILALRTMLELRGPAPTAARNLS